MEAIGRFFEGTKKQIVEEVLSFLLLRHFVSSKVAGNTLIYRLREEIAVGLPHYTNTDILCYFRDVEIKGLINNNKRGVVHHIRYIDNSLFVCRASAAENILQRLGQHSHIYPFKIKERGSTISLLDFTVSLSDGRITTAPTLKDRVYLSSRSSHPVHTHIAWPGGFVSRLRVLSPDRARFDAAVGNFRRALLRYEVVLA